jgi:hypothetical protein
MESTAGSDLLQDGFGLQLEEEEEEGERWMLRRQEWQQDDDEKSRIYSIGAGNIVSAKLAHHVGEGLRKLVGSNCVKIERGTVTPYYMCVGCKVEEAMGCIQDMRGNKSGNVRGECMFNEVMEGNMAHVMEQEQQAACCPVVNGAGVLTRFQGSAYPEAFRCLMNVGCEESTMYAQLVEECHGLCDYEAATDDDASVAGWTDGTICLADYAAAPRAVTLSVGVVVAAVAVIAGYLVV